MWRALELAARAEGQTSPNPMVGAVIEYRGRILAEGYHRRAGEVHAERAAMEALREEDRKFLPESTMYVTLEPCAHYGKQPPCADLLVESGIGSVIVAMQDPFEEVAGKGIQHLRAAGIHVEVGLLEQEATWLNRKFLTFHTRKRPFITLKWAMSSDGFIDELRQEDEPPTRFSNLLREREVHRLRAMHEAVLVGAHTATRDRARLNNRYWKSELQPHRLLLASGRVLSPDLPLFCSPGGEVWVLAAPEVSPPRELPREVRWIPLDRGEEMLSKLMVLLYEEGIQSLLVEGGTTTLQTFLDHGLYDALEVEVSSRILKKGIPAPQWPYNGQIPHFSPKSSCLE